MSWLQISITATKDSAEAIETLLLQSGAVSVTLKDADDKPILEPEIGTTPLWDNAIITGLFDSTPEHEALTQSLKSQLPAASELTLTALDDQDWTRAWMENYKSMQFGSRLWVCPWHIEPPEPTAVNLRLDPGLAFGTGTHPTTALCLSWLDKNIEQPSDVLDYGCGSGILAIAALLLGAKQADCVDIDEQAILATVENAKMNDVGSRINAMLVKSFMRSEPPPVYDVVLANILSGPLVELAPTLQAHVRQGGDIVLSGILLEQAEQTRLAYEKYFAMDDIQTQGDWVLLHGRKLD